MKRCFSVLVSVVAAVAVFAVATDAGAETFSLELKRLKSPTNERRTSLPADNVFRSAQPQYFRVQSGSIGTSFSQASGEAAFSKIVEKEPEYASKKPFRAVASLGTQKFAFALDVAAADKDVAAAGKAEDEKETDATKKKGSSVPKVERYTRLYFDLNHNNDLTDDQVIEAVKQREGVRYPPSYAVFSFPRVDITLDVDGNEVKYAFLMSGNCHASSTYRYAYAYLYGAAYREGEITLDGQKKRVVLVDFNSNGRFDDKAAVRIVNTSRGKTSYAQPGDVIYLDPDPNKQGHLYGYDVTTNDDQQYIAEMVGIGGKYYEMDVTAAGDKLTLTPSSAPVGFVKNPNKGFRAIVFSDQRVLKISWNESGKTPLPVGKWKLASYSIDGTKQKDTAKADEEAPSLLNVLAGAISRSDSSSRPRYTVVSARAQGDYPAIDVREGETVDIPFGPPYKPIVTASPRGAGQLYLSMSLVGVADESCSNLTVDGGRPAGPKFTITAPDGKQVQTGKFEYG